jgi:RHS repeat-associated protein
MTTSAPTAATGPSPICQTSTLAINYYDFHASVAKSDGSVWGWGDNFGGELGNGTPDDRNGHPVPIQVLGVAGNGTLGGIQSVSAGLGNVFGLEADATVAAWGSPFLGDGSSSNNPTPVLMKGPGGIGLLGPVLNATFGNDVGVALKANGTVWSWGYNNQGELGTGNTTVYNQLTPIQVVGPGGTGFLTGVTHVAAGGQHSLALKADGSVWAWGQNSYGQLGSNDGAASHSTPVEVVGPAGSGFLSNVVAIAAGLSMSVAVKADGTVWAWGDNEFGQFGNGTDYVVGPLRSSPTPVQTLGPGGVGVLSGITQLAIGQEHVIARKADGTAWGWGHNSSGETGNGKADGAGQLTPAQIVGPAGTGFLSGVSEVGAGSFFSGAVLSNGTVWTWGSNNIYGALGNGTTTGTNQPYPTQVVGPSGSGALAGVAQPGPCAPIRQAQCMTSPLFDGNISAYSLALKQSDGSVAGWGINSIGQLGDGTTTNRPSPIQVSAEGGSGTLQGAVSVAGGSARSLALKTDGTVLSWGSGPLGDGTTNSSLTPVHVVGSSGTGVLGGIVAVAEGDQTSYALRGADGTVWAWAGGGKGDLGNPAYPNGSLVPVPVVSPSGTGQLSGIVEIVGGTNQALALRSDGAIFAWGDNAGGDLGTNSPGVNISVPQQVVGPGGNGFFTNAVDIGAGQSYSMALRADGTVWTWGANNNYTLGTGDNAPHATPVEVVGPGALGFLTGIVQIAGTEEHSSAVDANGYVWSWGQNAFGELGNGDQGQTPAPSPVQVVAPGGGPLTNVTRVTGGEFFGAALKADGTVWTWGYNQFGQLGNGTADVATRSVPSQVVGQGGIGFLSGIAQSVPCAPAPPPPPPPPPGPTPAAEVGGGSPSAPPPTTCQHTGNPVNCATGEFWHRFLDLSIKGRGLGLWLARTYSSSLAGQDGPLGFGWTDTYNMALVTASDGAATVREEGGSTITFAANGSGGYTAPAWVTASLVKNSDGSYTMRRKDQTTYTFDSSGLLTGEQDRNGYKTTPSYSSGHLSAVADAAGRQLQFQYSGSHIVKVTDPIQRTVSFQYDTAGNLVAAIDAGGATTRFSYDGGHLLLTMTDPNGGVLTTTYDSTGRAVSQSDALKRTTTWSYGGGVTTITDPKGDVMQQTYKNGELVSLTKGIGTPQAANWNMSYDSTTFRLTSITDPNAHKSSYSSDGAGNVVGITDPLGRSWTFTYDPLNDLTSATDPQGTTSRMTYDANGNLASIVQPLSTTTQVITTISYDSLRPGDAVATQDPNGNLWKFGFDAYGNLIQAVDPIGNTRTFAYDVAGRMTSSVSAKGNVPGGTPANFSSSYTYSALDRLLSLVDPLGHKTSYRYDGNQNLVAVTDAAGHTATYAYDLDNEALSGTRTDGSQGRNAYDSNGHLSTQTDALGHSTNYGYDALERLTTISDALGRTTTISYDAAGNRSAVTDAIGRQTSYSYDAANQPTGIAYSDTSTHNVGYSYDRDGRRIAMVDGTGTTTYTYDQIGRLAQSMNGAGASVGYGYDLRGNMTSLTYPGGTAVTRTFDAGGRLTSVADWLGHRTTFGYDGNSNLTSQVYPNGTKSSLTYDAADQLTQIGYSGPMGQLTFAEGHDSLGQTTSENVVGAPPGGPVSYGYDPANRLVSANYGTTQLAYQYDAADRLTQLTATSSSGTVVSALGYDVADELLSSTRMQGNKLLQKLQFAYDANGNRTQRTDQTGSITSYTYDQRNRLVDYAGKAQYTYNGDGLRMSKTASGSTQTFTWDVAETLPLLIQDGATRYVTGPKGLPLEQILPDGTIRYYHQDAIGSTRALTNSTGQIDSLYAYDPYGNVTAFSGSTAANPFQFAGQYTDAESGLQYLRARYYDPSTASFLSRDPAVSITGQAYAYGNDSPLNYVDPLGLGITVDWMFHYVMDNSDLLSALCTGLAIAFLAVPLPVLAFIGAFFNGLSNIFGVLGAINDLMTGKPWWRVMLDLAGPVARAVKLIGTAVKMFAQFLGQLARGTSILLAIRNLVIAGANAWRLGSLLDQFATVVGRLGGVAGQIGDFFEGLAMTVGAFDRELTGPSPPAAPQPTAPLPLPATC